MSEPAEGSSMWLCSASTGQDEQQQDENRLEGQQQGDEEMKSALNQLTVC